LKEKGADMKNKEAQNCWEFWNCPKELRKRCSASISKLGKDCWIVMRKVLLKESPKTKNKFKFCWECPWFKHLNPVFQG
jgi:hypothetical protein